MAIESPRNLQDSKGQEIKGHLLWTRKYHLSVGSTPTIDKEFGDDVPWGDTLNDHELESYWIKKMDGTLKTLAMSPNIIENLKKDTDFLNPDSFSSDLEYCKKRGLDITKGEKILEELKRL
ncbi:MAG: hypothetical protein AAB970_00630 [Patescibacteria group bacterium]